VADNVGQPGQRSLCHGHRLVWAGSIGAAGDDPKPGVIAPTGIADGLQEKQRCSGGEILRGQQGIEARLGVAAGLASPQVDDAAARRIGASKGFLEKLLVSFVIVRVDLIAPPADRLKTLARRDHHRMLAMRFQRSRQVAGGRTLVAEDQPAADSAVRPRGERRVKGRPDLRFPLQGVQPAINVIAPGSPRLEHLNLQAFDTHHRLP